MTVYLTEEEQVEAIKSFFKKNARHLIIGACIMLSIFGAWRYWTWHERSIQLEASKQYELLMNAVSMDDHVKIHAYATHLIRLNSHATYADFARLILAKCDMNESKPEEAKQQLSTVASHAKLKALQQIARIRLARILLSEHHHAEALTVLKPVDAGNYQLIAMTLRGDVYAAQHDLQQAKTAYEQAKVLSQKLGVTNPLLDVKYTALLEQKRSNT